jgi:4-alpha-glucanotransferase
LNGDRTDAPGQEAMLLNERLAGVLLHPTSLPDGDGNGDLGEAAYRFVDFLAACGFGVWQTLPLCPTHGDGSPYSGISVHAGNENLVNLQRLVDAGWVTELDARAFAASPQAYRDSVRRAAFRGFLKHAGAEQREEWTAFVETHRHWLRDYALFRILHRLHHGRPWWEWPQEIRDREPGTLSLMRETYAGEIQRIGFEQFLYFGQWHALRTYAAERGVRVFGDIPLFVADDSADVWACRECFRLDANGRPLVVAGVPPDYFSETGQRWGNPLYDWDRMRDDGFTWWKQRIGTQLEQFDWLRIDHFRGLEACWEIPADQDTAIHGRWVKTPGAEMLAALLDTFHALPLIAEDLGIITKEVVELRERFGLPGMKILQFAWGGGPDNPYLPHNHEANSVVYTGTHDNNTTVGWFASAPPEVREHVLTYLKCTESEVLDQLLQSAYRSVAHLAIIPLQDLLGLDENHRMNVPGTDGSGNWRWRFFWEQIPDGLAGATRELLVRYGRCLP